MTRSRSQINGFEDVYYQAIDKKTHRGDSSEGSESLISLNEGKNREKRRMHTKSMIEIGGGGRNAERGRDTF